MEKDIYDILKIMMGDNIAKLTINKYTTIYITSDGRVFNKWFNEMKGSPSSQGTWQVKLKVGKHRYKNFRKALLVMYAFNMTPTYKHRNVDYETVYLDGDRSNCSLDNLVIRTHSDVMYLVKGGHYASN